MAVRVARRRGRRPRLRRQHGRPQRARRRAGPRLEHRAHRGRGGRAVRGRMPPPARDARARRRPHGRPHRRRRGRADRGVARGELPRGVPEQPARTRRASPAGARGRGAGRRDPHGHRPAHGVPRGGGSAPARDGHRLARVDARRRRRSRRLQRRGLRDGGPAQLDRRVVQDVQHAALPPVPRSHRARRGDRAVRGVHRPTPRGAAARTRDRDRLVGGERAPRARRRARRLHRTRPGHDGSGGQCSSSAAARRRRRDPRRARHPDAAVAFRPPAGGRGGRGAAARRARRRRGPRCGPRGRRRDRRIARRTRHPRGRLLDPLARHRAAPVGRAD
jgi:hypothetical protein